MRVEISVLNIKPLKIIEELLYCIVLYCIVLYSCIYSLFIYQNKKPYTKTV